MNFRQQCEREIIELHQALETWLGGQVAKTDANYARITEVHSDKFTYIVPGGEFMPRDRLFASLKQAHGANGNRFKI